MYNVPKYKPKIYLIFRNEERIEYENWEVFIENINECFAKNYLIDSFKEASRYKIFFMSELMRRIFVKESDFYNNSCIVRDEFGSFITKKDVLHALKENRRIKALEKPWISNRYNYRYRLDPVPYTSRRYHFGTWFKKPKTAQEMRWNIAHEEYVRGKRKKPNLPNSWDDNVRGDVRERKNWKRRRKTQWKRKTQNIKKYFEFMGEDY